MKKRSEQKGDAFLNLHIERIRSEINNHLLAASVKNTFFLPLFVILFFLSAYPKNQPTKYIFWIIAAFIVIIDLIVAVKHYLHIKRRQQDLNALLHKKRVVIR